MGRVSEFLWLGGRLSRSPHVHGLCFSLGITPSPDKTMTASSFFGVVDKLLVRLGGDTYAWLQLSLLSSLVCLWGRPTEEDCACWAWAFAVDWTKESQAPARPLPRRRDHRRHQGCGIPKKEIDAWGQSDRSRFPGQRRVTTGSISKVRFSHINRMTSTQMSRSLARRQVANTYLLRTDHLCSVGMYILPSL